MQCSRCGAEAHDSSATFCGNCGGALHPDAFATVAPPPQVDAPAWESSLGRQAPLQALIATAAEILFHPDRFFRLIAATTHSTLPAWLFGLICGGIGLVASWFWSSLFLQNCTLCMYSRPFFSAESVSPLTLMAAPLIVTLYLLFLTVYTRIIFGLFGLRKVRFPRIFRTLCYAECFSLMYIIPVVGTIAGTVAGCYAVLTGLHCLYGIRRLRVLVLLLLPLSIVFVAGLVLLFTLLLGGIIAGARSGFTLPSFF